MAVLFFYARLHCLFIPLVRFCCVVFFFRRPSLLVFFCCVKIVVAVVNVDFNWFQLRFFPPSVMSLWIGISLEFYALFTFTFFFLTKTIMEFALWFWFETFFFPTDSYSNFSWWSWQRLPFIFFTFFARRHSSFGLFSGVYRPFFLVFWCVALNIAHTLPTLDACTVSTTKQKASPNGPHAPGRRKREITCERFL
jgi:hypothetical protein